MPPPCYLGQWGELLSYIFHSFSQCSAPAETLFRHPCFACLGVMFLGDLYASCCEPVANAFTLPRFLELKHCC